MFIATDEHGISRHIRAVPCRSDAITNDHFNETAEYYASPGYEQRRSEDRKITLQDVAHQLTFRAKTGRSPKRNIAHGNTMGKC